MKRTLLLLLPVIAIAVAAPEASQKSREEDLGKLWQESVTAESNGDSAVAMEKLMTYAKNGGDTYLANLRAGWLNYSEKKYDDAGRFYATASKLQANALNPRLGLLNVAQAKGDVANATAAADAVLKIEPTNYRALMAYSWGCFQAKDYRRAGSTYQRVLAMYPEDQDATSGAAWFSLYIGQKREAIDGFRRLMGLNPEYANLRQGLEMATK
jgi:tetratricopeptide (TPR) repeat protein